MVTATPPAATTIPVRRHGCRKQYPSGVPNSPLRRCVGMNRRCMDCVSVYTSHSRFLLIIHCLGIARNIQTSSDKTLNTDPHPMGQVGSLPLRMRSTESKTVCHRKSRVHWTTRQKQPVAFADTLVAAVFS